MGAFGGVLERLSVHDSAVEVGVGERPELAVALAERGLDVTVTDVHERSVPAPVTFVRDDVTRPTLEIYDGADVIYARNLPPELQRPVAALARTVDAECCFTTLGGDPATVPVTTEALDDEPLYVARRGGPDLE